MTIRRKKGVSGPEEELRRFGLGYPESYEEFPWGHTALKIKKKVFAFLATSDEGFSLSVKLPESGREALLLPFTEPTGYGLGKSGWVSARFAPGAAPPLGILRGWIDESYRTVAPKKLVTQLDRPDTAPASPTRAAPTAKARKKSARRARKA